MLSINHKTKISKFKTFSFSNQSASRKRKKVFQFPSQNVNEANGGGSRFNKFFNETTTFLYKPFLFCQAKKAFVKVLSINFTSQRIREIKF